MAQLRYHRRTRSLAYGESRRRGLFSCWVVCAIVLGGFSAAGAAECLYNGKKHDDRYGRYPENFTGEVTCWDEGGAKRTDAKRRLMSREQWVNGEKDGPYMEYDWSRTGNVEETGIYRQGKKHGVVRKYDNDKLSHEAAYMNGKRRGVQKDYKDGFLSRVYFQDENGQVDTQIYLNKEGQPTLLRCGKNPISQQVAEWCGLDGKQSDVTFYRDDGKIAGTTQYLWGLEHGTRKEFNSEGKLKSEMQYERGELLKGGERRFDKQGTMLMKTDCDDKRSKCTETHFFEGGKQPHTVIVWKDGRKDQETAYYQNGKKKQELNAESAEFRYRILEYYDTGQLMSKGTYILASQWYWRSHIPDGLVESFYEDGTPWRREQYKNGRLQGQSVNFWERKRHRFRTEAEYDKDSLLEQKLFVDDKLVEESGYFPDGSIKYHRTIVPLPLMEG